MTRSIEQGARTRSRNSATVLLILKDLWTLMFVSLPCVCLDREG